MARSPHPFGISSTRRAIQPQEKSFGLIWKRVSVRGSRHGRAIRISHWSQRSEFKAMTRCSPMPAISFEAEHITNSLEVSFALALLNVIESTKKDPAQLRHIVYDLARVQLEQKSGDQTSFMNGDKISRLMVALEAAIAHVETFSCSS